MRTVILLTALCQLHPLRASWGRRHLVSLSWAQGSGSRKTGLFPLSSPSFLGPAFQVGAALNIGQAGPGWGVGTGAEGQLRLTQIPLSHLVFPDTKPYGALDLEVPGKLPATTWEKGKGSEVSVMLTVSAAAAKVCPRGCLRGLTGADQRAVPEACLGKFGPLKLGTVKA